MLIPVLLLAAAVVLVGSLIAWATTPNTGRHTAGHRSAHPRTAEPGRHTAEHLSTQPLMVVPDRLVEIGVWR